MLLPPSCITNLHRRFETSGFLLLFYSRRGESDGVGKGGGGRRWVKVRVRVKFGYFLDHPPTGLGLAPFYFPFILFFIGRFFFLLEQILFPDVYIFTNEKRNLSQVYTSIGGFHVTSSPPCLWTKTKDLLSAVLFSFPNIVRCIIVICVSRDCLQTTHSFNLLPLKLFLDPPLLGYSCFKETETTFMCERV